MLSPLIEPLDLRKGVLAANAKLVEVVRAVELHPDNAEVAPLLVVAGLVPEAALFPLDSREEVWLLLPDRERWVQQLRSRPSNGPTRQYADFAYAAQWYENFCAWLARELPLRHIDVRFEPELVGRVDPS
ncbi:hypothetical protein [Enhygromyxa salina]|nr:hypothetical protein [Enhygromyxa salina]